MRRKALLYGAAACIIAAALLFLRYYPQSNDHSDICIIGHSHAVGLQTSQSHNQVDYIAEVGMTAGSMLLHDKFALPNGGEGSLREGLEAEGYKRIYVILGCNDMLSGESPASFRLNMEKLLELIKECQPEAKICLLSIAPLSEGFFRHCRVSFGLPENADGEFNCILRDLALDYEADYLDIGSVLSDEKGFLAPQYDRGDGLHFNSDGNRKILDTILTHSGK